jgi:hypothetical protein
MCQPRLSSENLPQIIQTLDVKITDLTKIRRGKKKKLLQRISKTANILKISAMLHPLPTPNGHLQPTEGNRHLRSLLRAQRLAHDATHEEPGQRAQHRGIRHGQGLKGAPRERFREVEL